jgi:hypothetical protein
VVAERGSQLTVTSSWGSSYEKRPQVQVDAVGCETSCYFVLGHQVGW